MCVCVCVCRCVCYSGFLPLYNGTGLQTCIDPIIQAGTETELRNRDIALEYLYFHTFANTAQ